MENVAAIYEFIVETAFLAGRLTTGYFQNLTETEYKSDSTPVTAADRKGEELIRARIEQYYPSHQIVGEEFGEKNSGDGRFRWFIDPIDGTKSFSCGVPLYAVLIGFEIDGKIEAGAAYFPALDEMISAATGIGCWWNGRRCRVSTTDKLSESYISTTSPQLFFESNRSQVLNTISDKCYHLAGWSDAYGYLLVATGRIEAMLDPIMNAWDCGPFPVILREAGG